LVGMASIRMVKMVALGRSLVIAILAWTAWSDVGGIGTSMLLATTTGCSPNSTFTHTEHVLNTTIGTVHKDNLPSTQ